MKKLEKLQYRAPLSHELKQQIDLFMEDRPESENIYLDKDRFDAKKFNQVFDNHRLYDPNQEGYGDEMSTDNRLKEPDTMPQNSVFTGPFNKQIFDSLFEQQKAENTKRDLIIFYIEPVTADAES